MLPVYNGAATVARALQSVLDQDATGVECVVVDDGSSDGTLAEVERVLAQDVSRRGRCRVVRLSENRGLAHAAATGIREARGEYVGRCDADDRMLPGALRLMLEAAERSGGDVVAGAIESGGCVHGGECDELNEMPVDVWHFGVWNKLLRRSLLMDNDILPYDGVDCWEDVCVVSRALALADVCVTIPEAVYGYTVHGRGESLSGDRKERVLSDRLEAAKRLDAWFGERGLSERYGAFLDALKFHAKVKMLRRPGIEARRWKRTFPEINSRIMSIKTLPLVYRVAFALAGRLIR